MKNKMYKLLAVVSFGLILSSSVMAGEHFDAFTPHSQGYSASTTGVISKTSYTPSITTDSILGICYNSVN
ncbi:MAG: hypothetical protein KAG34_04660 [Cocleimonas sp.]|nr:hypothetical protein [Cocleimonas sp.]